MNTPIVPPIVLRPDQVPEDLTCTICMTVAMDPRITPCQHVFCKSCINSALDISQLCPIDRQECSIHQLVPLQGCLFRIWSNIQVKCGNGGCTWNGSIEDYLNHVNQCNSAQHTQDLSSMREEMETLKEENSRLNQQLQQKRSELGTLTQDNRNLNQRLRHKEAELVVLTQDNHDLRRELKNKRETLKQENGNLRRELKNRPNLPPLFVGEYNYRRENVVQLSQLISRHLEGEFFVCITINY